MPPRLRRLSGREVIRVLARFGFAVVAQRGSHAKLRRRGPHGEKQTLTVPTHDELDTGTVRGIFRQATRYVPEDELCHYFYVE